MTAETTNAPAAEPAPEGATSTGSRRWFETVPQDWPGFLALRAAVTESRHVRETFRDWMLNHLDEKNDALKLGLGLFAAGEPDRALPHLEAADGELPKLLLALAHDAARQRKAAATVLAELVASPGMGERARMELARVHFELRDIDALRSDLESLGDTSESNRSYVAGMLAEAEGDHDTAMAAWSEAIEADSQNSEATFRLAQLLELRGDDDGAMDLYGRFLVGELPAHIGALMNLGILHEDQENHRWAATCFRLVTEADPTNRRAHTYLNDAEASLEQYYDESRERKADKQNAVLRIPVTDFELSVRARNCLQRMHIHTLGDLVCRTESELLSFKNFGETSLQEVKDILGMKGLRLGMAPTGDFGVAVTAETTQSLAPDGNVNDIKISELDLSVRSRAALATLGITKVGDLVATTETTLLSCKNFGQTSLDEIKSRLRSLNLNLGT